MTKIILPPLPSFAPSDVNLWVQEPSGKYVELPVDVSALVRARDLEVARRVLEAAAKVLTEYQIAVGNSAAGEMACEWTYDALKECRDAIRALEVRHD